MGLTMADLNLANQKLAEEANDVFTKASGMLLIAFSPAIQHTASHYQPPFIAFLHTHTSAPFYSCWHHLIFLAPSHSRYNFSPEPSSS
jgi:hypothetical protein